MDQLDDSWAMLAALEWQIELGADEAIAEAPIDRYALTQQQAAKPKVAAAPPPLPKTETVDPVAEARLASRAAGSLDALRDALDAFPHCELRHGAHSLVFSDGNPAARLMILGEAPGRDEDRLGRPFVGRAGQLLDRMLAAINLDRAHPDADRAVYITNVLPWRPPQNRDPKPEEIAMMKPFVERHIALADPDVLILMGNISCAAMLGRRGITRLRGGWTEVAGRPTLPMFHPAYLLRQAHAKREAWADLLAVQARLRQGSIS